MPLKPTIGIPFTELQQVQSTNNYAIGLVHAGMAQHGIAVFANHQTAGKGQRDKEWKSEAGKNIALSIIVEPDTLYLSHSFLLSIAMAVGVYRFLKFYAGDDIKIKWPNDIYWRDRKTAGILIENVVQGANWKWSIVGVGININQTSFDEAAMNAASLKQITGRDFEPLSLAKELCTYLEKAFYELNNSRADIIGQYKKAVYKLDQAVLLKKGPRSFTATIKDVTLNGQLVVQTSVEETFDVGEVEWIIAGNLY